MAITLQLPAEIEQQLQRAWDGQLPRRALEALAVEAHRQGLLTHAQVGHVLGLDRWQTDTLLKDHASYLDISAADLQAEQAALDRLLGR